MPGIEYETKAHERRWVRGPAELHALAHRIEDCGTALANARQGIRDVFGT